jgi:hypothetical protein
MKTKISFHILTAVILTGVIVALASPAPAAKTAAPATVAVVAPAAPTGS